MNKTKLHNWLKYYEDIGVPLDIYSNYIPYITKLLSNNVPVILDFNHLAGQLGRTGTYTASTIFGTNKHYRAFYIKKKSGGQRQIDAPYPALLDCQRWIYSNILLKIPVHEAVHGFRQGKSIFSNANKHLGNQELLNIDLKDFFPSIGIKRVIKVFNKLGYPNDVSFFLASLCCLDKKLPQGAPTSPALSNIIAYSLDVRLSLLAKKYKLAYSRYADDITFSGNQIPKWLVKLVQKIVIDCGFSLNDSKTRWATSIEARKMVTGLVLKDNHLTVPKVFRHKLRQELYFIKEYGLNSHLTANKIRDPQYLNRVKGKLCFWKQAEPKSELVHCQLNFIKALSQSL